VQPALTEPSKWFVTLRFATSRAVPLVAVLGWLSDVDRDAALDPNTVMFADDKVARTQLTAREHPYIASQESLLAARQQMRLERLRNPERVDQPHLRRPAGRHSVFERAPAQTP